MVEQIAAGFMVFLVDGAEGVGAVRRVLRDGIVVYVEKFGEFTVLADAISDVHSQKVLLKPAALDRNFLDAIKHSQDSEDPKLVG